MKRLIQKFFGKKNNNNMEETNPANDFNRYSYQWIKGDNIGQVQEFKEVLEHEGFQYVVFTDGTRINASMLDEFMVRVEKGFYEPAFDRERERAEKNQTRQISGPQIMAGQKTGRSEVHQVIKEETPIAALLKKQKENWVDVDLNLTINLPKKPLWDVIVSSFDNAEDEIIEYVTKDLDIEVVRDALKKSIKDIYLAKQKTQPVKHVRTQNSISESED